MISILLVLLLARSLPVSTKPQWHQQQLSTKLFSTLLFYRVAKIHRTFTLKDADINFLI